MNHSKIYRIIIRKFIINNNKHNIMMNLYKWIKLNRNNIKKMNKIVKFVSHNRKTYVCINVVTNCAWNVLNLSRKRQTSVHFAKQK